MNTGCLHYGPDYRAGNNAGAWDSRLEKHPASTIMTYNIMGNGSPCDRNFNHIFLGPFSSLAKRLWYLLGLAHCIANLALTVANNSKSAEAEPPAALDNLCHTVNKDYFFNQAQFVIILWSYQGYTPYSLRPISGFRMDLL